MYSDTLGSSTIFDLQNFMDEFFIVIMIIQIAFLVIGIISGICLFKMFKKASQPAWIGFIPGYNTYILIKIAQLPSWYLLLYFIPFANVYAIIKIKYEITHRFGYQNKMALLYVVIPIIPMFIFAFKANYTSKEIQENKKETKETEINDNQINDLNNFKPEITADAVPFEKSFVSYNKEITPQNIELTIKPEDLINTEIVEQTVEQKEIISPVNKSVPFEKTTQSYEPIVQTSAIVDASLLVEKPIDQEEEHRINIPKGETIIENVIVPDGTPIIKTEYKEENKSTLEKKPEIKNCPKCGMKIEAKAETCFMCGYKFENKEEENL